MTTTRGGSSWRELICCLVTVLFLSFCLSFCFSCGARPDRFRQGATAGAQPAKGTRTSRAQASDGSGACGTNASDAGQWPAVPGKTRFVVLGDYGSAGPNEAKVAALVKGWSPDFIITTGDNNYPNGGADTIDGNIGQYFHEFIANYVGRYGCGAARNRFFPSLGNHDWYTPGAKAYRDYFSLPGNERYYDVVIGDVHLFALDSDPSEPDGVTADSAQAAWLKARLASSTAVWQVVYMHHPPYSSGPHQSSLHMRWPYQEWGADIVLAGHDHDYERFDIGGLTYVVNGLGGKSLYQQGPPLPGSLVRYDSNFGAMIIEAEATNLTSRFVTVDDEQIDRFVLNAAP